MGYDYDRARRVVHRQILRWGASRTNPTAVGHVRCGGEDSAVTMAVVDYTAKERASGLGANGGRKAIVSALSRSEPPDFQHDVLVFRGDVLRILSPVERFRGGSGEWVYFECEVERS